MRLEESYMWGDDMEKSYKENQGMINTRHSIENFSKRVLVVLSGLVVLASVVVFSLIYLPLKTALEKSLIDNFKQLAYIRYTSLENSIERSREGARSLSSRTVIRDAILEYKDGKISLSDLETFTQSKYEDGASALEHLLKAERYMDGNTIVKYLGDDYFEHSCPVWDKIKRKDRESGLCLTEEHEYFVVRSPIVFQGRTLAYDQLAFDLSYRITSLCTEDIKSELIYQNEFRELVSKGRVLEKKGNSLLMYINDIYYQAYSLEEDAYFIIKQNKSSLMKPVYQLSRHVLMVGIGILIFLALGVYYLIILQARSKMENDHSSLSDAMLEVNTDSLTKAKSRKFSEEILLASFVNFKEGEESPALILLDIDSLKMVNDKHGHSIGDQVIISIAKTIKDNIRNEDILARWGGDEFVGIFAGLAEEDATSFADKLLSAVSGLQIETEFEIIRPTISIGISYFREEDSSFMDGINRADEAMYKSKINGKNMVHKL